MYTDTPTVIDDGIGSHLMNTCRSIAIKDQNHCQPTEVTLLATQKNETSMTTHQKIRHYIRKN